jgi:hypothetical protein
MRLIITFLLTTLFCSQLPAQILLDEVMSRDEQQKTGVAKMSRTQKTALEAWLNKNFALKAQTEEHVSNLSLSINIDGGKKLELSDNSIWEIAPDDVQKSVVWITPFPVQISPSGDPDYPCLIINTNSGASVRARQINTSMSQPSPPNP